MNNPVSMQGVLHRYLEDYHHHHRLSAAQHKVCRHLSACRTEALGGEKVKCSHCGFKQIRYHSCRNRHCPQCQHTASQQWLERQLQQVLPVNYFHVVFTLPHELNGWVQCQDEVIYRCLFASVWETLKTFAADKKRLNGELGMTAVLHTWGQNLSQHVHLHCLIPGGALSKDQRHWRHAKSNYLFPVKALSRHFRGRLVSRLREAFIQGQLTKLKADEVDKRLNSLMQQDWVVYSKPYLQHPETVVQYLSRYTHRIAISDSRLVSVEDKQVRFKYKDYRDNTHKCISLDAEEFIRRFLLHVLPQGFRRVRHYGFLSNRIREQRLANIRACLKVPAQEKSDQPTKVDGAPASYVCPKCRSGRLRITYEMAPQHFYGR